MRRAAHTHAAYLFAAALIAAATAASAQERAEANATETFSIVDDAPQPAAAASPLDTDLQRAGYTIGLAIGQRVQRQIDGTQFPMDRDAVLLGIADALNRIEPRLTRQEMRAATSAIGQRMAPDQSTRLEAEKRARAEMERAIAADENRTRFDREQAEAAHSEFREQITGRPDARPGASLSAADRQIAEREQAGRELLRRNRLAPSITTLESGLQYRALITGDGPKPEPTHRFFVHYVGKHADGDVFESSRDAGGGEPLSFTLDQVILGWGEALPMMNIGSKWELWVPPHLAFGDRGREGKVLPRETVVFELELIRTEPINTEAPPQQPAAEAPRLDENTPADAK